MVHALPMLENKKHTEKKQTKELAIWNDVSSLFSCPSASLLSDAAVCTGQYKTGIKWGLRTEYKTRTRYKTRTTNYVYNTSFRKVKQRNGKRACIFKNSSSSSLPQTKTFRKPITQSIFSSCGEGKQKELEENQSKKHRIKKNSIGVSRVRVNS